MFHASEASSYFTFPFICFSYMYLARYIPIGTSEYILDCRSMAQKPRDNALLKLNQILGLHQSPYASARCGKAGC